MNLQVTIGFNEEALSAISGLTEAIRSIGGTHANVTRQTATDDTVYPVYWRDAARGSVGIAKTAEDYDLVKRNMPKAYKIDDVAYRKYLEENKAELEAAAAESDDKPSKAKAEKPAKAKAEKPAKSAKSAAEDKPAKAASEKVPSLDDLVAVVTQYLPQGLTKEERAPRAAFVKPILNRFGAAKASELAPEHRAIVMNLIERKMAGEDVDPETAEYEEIVDNVDSDEDDMI